MKNENSKFELKPLPYARNALEPHISAETLEYHYGAHHKAYVKKLNELVEGTPYKGMPLADIICQAPPGPIFNNAAQVWNHDFYWQSLNPQGGGSPSGNIAEAIKQGFGSLKDFKQAFEKECTELFGTGWVWLAQTSSGALVIRGLGDAGNPMTQAQRPILVCDLWEHAYYIDQRNKKERYLQAFWKLVNWEFAEANLGEPAYIQSSTSRMALNPQVLR